VQNKDFADTLKIGLIIIIFLSRWFSSTNLNYFAGFFLDKPVFMILLVADQGFVFA